MAFKFVSVALTALCAAVIAPQASAQLSGIYVEYYTSGDACLCNPSSFGDGWVPVPGFADRRGGCPCAGTAQPGLTSGSTVSFSGTSGTTYRVFHATGGSIGNISVSGSGFTLLVGRSSSTFPPFTDASNNLGASAGSSVGTVTANFGTVQVYAGSVGAVTADSVVRVDASNSITSVSSVNAIGTVRAPSIGNVSASTGITGVVVNNWDFGSAASDYTSTASTSSGNIGSVAVTGARMRGTVQASTGSIGTVSSTVGIGPASGTAATIRARSGITTVNAPTINANIDAQFGGGTGPIQTLTASTGSFTGSLTASSIGSSGSGISVAGTMPASMTIYGTTAKAVTVSGSTTGTVFLVGGVSQPVSFNGGYSGSSLGVGALSSSLTISGNLAVPATIDSTASGGSISISGNIPVNNTLTITNSHAGSLTVGGVASGLIKVGGASTGTMTFGSSGVPGLNGQVVVNAQNSTWNWTGNVRLQGGGVTVTPTSNKYDNLSSVFGTDTNGGAVGRGTYAHHSADSSPKQGGMAANWYATPPSLSAFEAVSPRTLKSAWFANNAEIQARFYGPVVVHTASGFSLPDPRAAGVTVWFSPSATFDPSNAVDVSTLFEVDLPSLDYNRDLQIRPICGEDYRDTNNEMRGVYRVELNDASRGGIYTSELRSQYIGSPGSEPKVAAFGHYFRFFCSKADLGAQGGEAVPDGGLTNDDYIVFINYFFASDPRADLGQSGGFPGADGMWDNNDYIAFINYYFAGCDAEDVDCFARGGGEHMVIPAEERPAPTLEEIQQQLDALFAVYSVTEDPRVLERINALTGGAGR